MMKRKNIAVFIILSIIGIYNIMSTQAECPDFTDNNDAPDFDSFDYKIWLFNDVQPQDTNTHGYNYTASRTIKWRLPLWDVNNLTWDVGVCIGDLIEGDTGEIEYTNILNDYKEYLYNYIPSNLTSNLPFDDYPYTYSSNSIWTSFYGTPVRHLYGNHEAQISLVYWYNNIHSNDGNAGDYVWYFGNICFIMASSHSAFGQDWGWVNTQVANNQDKIIIICYHYPYKCHSMHIRHPTYTFTSFTLSDTLDNYDVDMFINGHNHDVHQNCTYKPSGSEGSCDMDICSQTVCSNINIIDNTTFLNNGCYAALPGINDGDSPPQSYFICLNDNSNQAFLYSRNHTKLGDFNGYEVWNQTASWNEGWSAYAYNLSKPFIGPYPINNPPDTPIIDGPPTGRVGVDYEFTFHATDPEGDDVKYFIDWGDNNSEWTDYYPSCTNVTVKYTWSEKGTYKIQAKAKDSYGAESTWRFLIVNIPKTRTTFNSFLLRFLEQFPILNRLFLLLK